MKTSSFFTHGKRLLPVVALLVLTELVSILTATAQPVAVTQSAIAVQRMPASPSVPVPAGYVAAEFKAFAFPVLTPMQVRVVFENPTACPVLVLVGNCNGEIVYRRVYRHTPKYNSLLDFAQFPAGEYWLRVKATTLAAAKIHHLYEQTFQIRSQTDWSIAPSEKNFVRSLYKSRPFLSRK
jgi:hypothetical protein